MLCLWVTEEKLVFVLKDDEGARYSQEYRIVNKFGGLTFSPTDGELTYTTLDRNCINNSIDLFNFETCRKLRVAEDD